MPVASHATKFAILCAALVVGCGSGDASSTNGAPSSSPGPAGGSNAGSGCTLPGQSSSSVQLQSALELTGTTVFQDADNALAGGWDYLRVDATHAYWQADDRLFYRVSLQGGDAEVVGELDAGLWMDFVLTDDSLLIRRGDDFVALPKAGGDPSTVVSVDQAASPSTLRTLARDDNEVFLFTYDVFCSDSSVQAISLSDYSVRTVADGLACPDDIVLDEQYVYVTDPGHLDTSDYKPHEPKVLKIPKAGGDATPLETGTRVTRLRAAGDSLFGLIGDQAEEGAGLVRVEKGGGLDVLASADCQFGSDVLEVVAGGLLYQLGSHVILVDQSGKVLAWFDPGVRLDHESIAVVDNHVYVTYFIDGHNRIVRYDVP